MKKIISSLLIGVMALCAFAKEYTIEIDKIIDVVSMQVPAWAKTNTVESVIDVSNELNGLESGDTVTIKWNGKPSRNAGNLDFSIFSINGSNWKGLDYWKSVSNIKKDQNLNISFSLEVKNVDSSSDLYILYITSQYAQKPLYVLSENEKDVPLNLTLKGKEYKLVFNEEFNNDLHLDRESGGNRSLNNKWFGWGQTDRGPLKWADRKTQRTRKSPFKKAVLNPDVISKNCIYTEDGILHIVQKRELEDNTMTVWEPNLSTDMSFKRGYFEYKWKLPKKAGGLNIGAALGMPSDKYGTNYVKGWELRWMFMHEIFSYPENQLMYSPSLCSVKKGTEENYGQVQNKDGGPTWNEGKVYDIKDEDFFDVWHTTKLLWDEEGVTIWEDDLVTLERKWTQMLTGEPDVKMGIGSGNGNGGEWVENWNNLSKDPNTQKIVNMMGPFDPYASEIDYQIDYWRVYQLPEDM